MISARQNPATQTEPDSLTWTMADSLWGLCAGDPFEGEWNQNCIYWTAIYAGAPAALFLICTLITASTLLAFPAVRASRIWLGYCAFFIYRFIVMIALSIHFVIF